MHLSYQRPPNHGNKLAIGQGFPKHHLGGVAHAFQNGSIGVENRAVQVEQRHIALGLQGNKGIGHNELSSFKNDLRSEARPNITIHKPTSKTAKRALHTSCRRRSVSMREGQPVQQPVKPAPVKAFCEVEGHPAWESTMPATALTFPRGGRPSPRLADQYEDASMRAVERFLANNLGYVASGHDRIRSRPFACKEFESAKGPFISQGGSFGEIA